MALLPVVDAVARILRDVKPLEVDMAPLAEADGRTLATSLSALRTQPPFSASAMDGYALRAQDAAAAPVRLRVIGASVAGRRFTGRIGPGEAVRIFTGAPLPEGADAIVIQEDAILDGDVVLLHAAAAAGIHVRKPGLDFKQGDLLLQAGRRLDPRAIGLAAAMGHGHVPVFRKPRVAILATGDELVVPGVAPGPDQIVLSNSFTVAALARAAGAETIDLGIAGDNYPSLNGAIDQALAFKADILATSGGASVGDHDLVQSALVARGMTLDFWRIAMRPGKPFMFGAMPRPDRAAMRLLGFPGNPVSAYICALLFLAPLLRAMQGDPGAREDKSEWARLGGPMAANDQRQEYARAQLFREADGVLIATPAPSQDSSLTRLLADAGALIVREPFAPPAAMGERCRIIRLAD